MVDAAGFFGASQITEKFKYAAVFRMICRSLSVSRKNVKLVMILIKKKYETDYMYRQLYYLYNRDITLRVL